MAIKALKLYLSNIADAIRGKTYFPNLFDKDNANIVKTSDILEWGTTDTGVYFVTGGATTQSYLTFSLGSAIDFARKTVTLTYEHTDIENKNISASLSIVNPSTGGIFANWYESSSNQDDNTAWCRYVSFEGQSYDPDKHHLCINLFANYYPKGTRVEFNNIMVTLSSSPMPYLPYGASPDRINAQSFADKISEVYSAGAKSEYDRFWDENQFVGKRDSYKYGFSGKGWNDYTYNPKYTIKPAQSAERMFAGCAISKITNVDFSNATTLSYLFYDCTELKYVGEIDASKVSSTSGMDCIFYYCEHLETVERIKPKAGVKYSYSNSFYRCISLKYIFFTEPISKTVSFSYSPLSVESLKNIITMLEDFNGTTTEFSNTVTFKSSAFAVLEEEGATAEYNGVACTWRELVSYKKWNLVA